MGAVDRAVADAQFWGWRIDMSDLTMRDILDTSRYTEGPRETLGPVDGRRLPHMEFERLQPAHLLPQIPDGNFERWLQRDKQRQRRNRK